MIENTEIKRINDFLKLEEQPAIERAQAAFPDELVSKIAGGFKSREEKEKYKMSLWLEKALGSSADFSTLVVELLEIKGYQNDYPRFYNKAEIDRRLFSKIISVNQSYHPDIKTVYKIIIGLELSLEQANELLRAASYSFGGSVYSLIIQYCVKNRVFEHKKIDEYLMEFCGDTLYSIK